MHQLDSWLKFTIGMTFIGSLAACSSGSGGGGQTPPGTQRLQYQGVETSALLTPDNVGEILTRVLNVGEFPTDSIGGVASENPGEKPSSMRHTEKTVSAASPAPDRVPINETTACTGGGHVTMKGELNEMALGTLAVTYNQCILDGNKMHGTGSFEIKNFDWERQVPDRFIFDLERMELTSGNSTLLLSGAMDYTILPDQEIVLNNLVMYDQTSNLNYRLKNFKIISRAALETDAGLIEVEEIHGRLYLSDIGFLDIDTLEEIHQPIESEQLPISGRVKISGNGNRFFITDFRNKGITYNLLGNGQTYTSYLLDTEFDNPTTIDLSDADNDGMHDSFERASGLDPAVDDANLNEDGDLFTNREEYIKRSDLRNADSPRAPEVRIGLDLKVEPFEETETFHAHELGMVPALTYGDTITLSLTLNNLWAAAVFEEFHGFEKLSIGLDIPAGFEVTGASSGEIECVHAGQILCTFPEYFNLDQDVLLFQAQVKVGAAAAQGIHRFNLRAQGFFTMDPSDTLPSAAVLVGLPLAALQETFSRQPAQNEIKQVTLDQDVYWGHPTLEFSTKLSGGSAGGATKVYLTGDMLVNHHDVEISGIEFFGDREIYIHNSPPDDANATLIKSNTFNNARLICATGNVSLVGNLFKSGRSQIASGQSCNKLSAHNNILTGIGNFINLEGTFAKLEFVNNTVKGGGLGILFPLSSASPGHPEVLIANNIFLGGSTYSTEHLGIQYHIYMLEDYRSTSVITHNFFEHTGVYIEPLQLATQMEESNLHSSSPGVGAESQLFRIQPGSLLIDKGLPQETDGAQLDYFGNPRNADGDGNGEPSPDIGAHEYTLD